MQEDEEDHHNFHKSDNHEECLLFDDLLPMKNGIINNIKRI